jgi:hypothetical protein
MTKERDAVDLALLACLGGDPDGSLLSSRLRALRGTDWETFVERARAQRVGPLIYDRITASGLAGEVPVDPLQTLRWRYRSNSIRNLWLQGALHSILESFHEAAVPVILLKGAYVSTHVYGNLALREMSDIDLLVREPHLKEGLRILQGAGFDAKTRLPDDIDERVTTSKHAPRLSRGKAAVELHWTIFAPGHVSVRELNALWARAAPATVAGVEALALCTEDLLVHACGHAAYDHRFEFGLRPLCDIDRIVRKSGDAICWTAVVDRAVEWNWRRGVYLALHLARELLGTAVPDDVLGSLEPSPLDDGIVSSAAQMVFTDPSYSRSLHRNVVRWHRETLKGRLRLLYDRVRWCPEQTDPTIGYYARHISSLVIRHSPALFRLFVGDERTRDLAYRKRTLAAWLENGTGSAREQP